MPSEESAPPVVELKIPTWDELPKYVKNAFDTVAINEGFEDFSFSIAPGFNKGDGFMSVMLKVIITGVKKAVLGVGGKSNQSLKVICKMPPMSPERREMMQSAEAFGREIFVYTEYLPFLVEFQESRGIPLEDRFLNFPKCYYGKFDKTTGDAVIILEDLRDLNYSMYPKTEPMTFEYCRLVMEALGKYHGLSIAAQNNSPQQFDKLRYASPGFLHLLMSQPSFEEMWDVGFGSLLNCLGDTGVDADIKQTVIELKPKTREVLLEADTNPCYPYGVIGHGDSWINNFMFLRDEKEKPTKAVVIDWQIAHYGSPALDLTYFLFISTDKSLRDQYWYQLLGIYYDALCSIIQKAGYDGRELFPFEELLRQLKHFGKYGLILSLMLVPFMQVPSNEIIDFDDSMKAMKENGKADVEMLALLKPRGEGTETRMADIFRDGRKFGMI